MGKKFALVLYIVSVFYRLFDKTVILKGENVITWQLVDLKVIA